MANMHSAEEYLQKHQISALFERLTADALYYKPGTIKCYGHYPHGCQV